MWVGNVICDVFVSVYELAPYIAAPIFAAIWPVLIIFGAHWAFNPIILNNFSVLGYDWISPLTWGCNFAMAGACLGVFLKTKSAEFKELAGPNVVTALFAGITEPDFSSASAIPYATAVFDLAHELDPQKRPCSYTNVTRCRAGIDKCTHLADFMMLNRYDGWYVSPGPEISDAREILIDEMHKWEELEPNKPFVFTEYGTDTVAGIHKLPSVMWAEEYQVEYFKMVHEIYDLFDWVVGEQPWNLADFQTVEGKMRVDGNKKGAFTRDRQPKAVAFLLRERWTAKPDYLDK